MNNEIKLPEGISIDKDGNLIMDGQIVGYIKGTGVSITEEGKVIWVGKNKIPAKE